MVGAGYSQGGIMAIPIVIAVFAFLFVLALLVAELKEITTKLSDINLNIMGAANVLQDIRQDNMLWRARGKVLDQDKKERGAHYDY
jgi:hypothetical protein